MVQSLDVNMRSFVDGLGYLGSSCQTMNNALADSYVGLIPDSNGRLLALITSEIDWSGKSVSSVTQQSGLPEDRMAISRDVALNAATSRPHAVPASKPDFPGFPDPALLVQTTSVHVDGTYRIVTIADPILVMAVSIQRSVFLEAIEKHDPSSTAVVNNDSGTAFSYGTLLRDVACAKERLLQIPGRASIAGERVAFLVENGYNYVGMECILPLLHAR